MPGSVPRTIIDTGVLIAALGRRAGRPAMVVAAAVAKDAAVYSEALLAEYEMALNGRRAVRHHGLTPAEVADFLDSFRRLSTEFAVMPGPECPDLRDQHLWDLLTTVPEAVLVTGEAALRASSHFPGRVLSPGEFVERYLEG